jgi:hypothetical protein
VLGVREDGQKVLLAAKNSGGETSAAWRAVLDDLVKRGLRKPELLIVDGSTGLEQALAANAPEDRELGTRWPFACCSSVLIGTKRMLGPLGRFTPNVEIGRVGTYAQRKSRPLSCLTPRAAQALAK